jgi:ABC-type transport system involved in multi-copper enzyme maturation permease subunit
MKWSLWAGQAVTIMNVELKRYVLGRRWIGVYAAAYAPVALLLAVLALQPGGPAGRISLSDRSQMYAFFFQTFALRLSVFFSCALVFSQLFRGEILEKTLHFYLLAPVRREVIAAGKYMAGVVAMGAIFGTSTILTNILIYMPLPSWSSFFLEDAGLSNLVRYFLVTLLACAAYGGIFTFTGLYFRNPIIPAILVAGWEAFYFVLPASLQKVTVMHYLQSLLPLIIDRGPFSVVVDASSAVFSVLALLGICVLLVWASGRMLCKTQITYSAD